MDAILELLKSFWALTAGLIGSLLALIPKAVILSLWVACGIIVLPCVYVAGILYPKWVDWGEKL